MPNQLYRTLNEVYTDWKGQYDTGGFFYYLHYYAEENSIVIPFISHYNALDLEYHGNHSGNKLTSCLVDKWFDTEFTPAYAVKIAEIFWKLYGENLLKLYNLYGIEYNPISNYDMQEDTTDTADGTDSNVRSGSQSDATYGTTATENKVQGLDSTTYEPSERSETTYGTSQQNPMSTTTTYNDITDETTYGKSLTRDSHKYGNIGVRTTQEMLQSEIKLWEWNFYNKVLFPAVDELLTTPVY